MRRERADTDLDIIFLIFCCSSHMCLLGVLFSYLCSGCGTSLRSTPQNGCQDFWSILTSPRLVSNKLSFPVFCPTSLQTPFPFQFLPANQSPLSICCWRISIFNPGICCYPVLDLGTHTIHLPIHFSPTIMSLFLPLPQISFSYMSLLFPSPAVNLKI